jgi:aminoglycoside phosphotransferase (APT) family kinase protein
VYVNGVEAIEEPQLAESVLRAAQSSATPLASATSVSLRRLQGGYSGITYVVGVEVSGQPEKIVVKVAPPGLEPVRNRDVLRQAAMIGALGGSSIPVPKLLFMSRGCGDVPPFYATEFVEGEAYEPIFDGPGRCSDDEIRSRSLECALLLARLHQVDVGSLPVDPGPTVTPADEVDRWTGAFLSLPEDLQFSGLELGRALATRPPEPMEPVLVHGDYRLGNMIAAGGSIHAVLDWEIWSRSDPRMDVAWFITQADARSHPLACWQPPGMPTAETLVATYERELGEAVGPLGWFSALVRFKVAATSALIVKHNRSAPTPDQGRSKWEPGIPPLLHDGLRILEEES